MFFVSLCFCLSLSLFLSLSLSRSLSSSHVSVCAALLRLTWFPECQAQGTRSPDGALLEFKKGVDPSGSSKQRELSASARSRGPVSMAKRAKVPIVPVTILGTGRLMPSKKDGRGASWASWAFELAIVRVLSTSPGVLSVPQPCWSPCPRLSCKAHVFRATTPACDRAASCRFFSLIAGGGDRPPGSFGRGAAARLRNHGAVLSS